MPKESATRKTRSAIACENCHQRKVRCNAAFQGIPCSNCLQDRVQCKIYGRRALLVQSTPLLQPRPADVQSDQNDLPTPSTETTDNVNETSRDPPLHGETRNRSSISTLYADRQGSAHFTPPREKEMPTTCHTSEVRKTEVPFFAGDSEGLEFIFDVCAPKRTLRGPHYVVGQHYHPRLQMRQQRRQDQGSWPEPGIRDEFMRLYFHYVHPFLPVLDADEVLRAYDEGVDSISRLLLWSMFFAAANFVSVDVLDTTRFPTRKALKEYLYLRAKDIYDAQEESNKTTIIQSVLLLAYWYGDREDIDGTWHWLGVALGLSHTIGLHRTLGAEYANQKELVRSHRVVWKRIWWCLFYREVFAAHGFGRPMRVNPDECDVELPSVNDVLIDYRDIPQRVVDKFLPRRREQMAHLWIELLHLSVQFERILAIHYRPRRPLLSLSGMEIEEANLRNIRDNVTSLTDQEPDATLLHSLHLQTYLNMVIIVLYRQYILDQPEHLTPQQQRDLSLLARWKAREAAADLTSTSNKLISLDMIDLAANMLVTSTMTAASIHLYEIKNSSGLAREFALNHYNLHVLILAQLQKTYWTADYQHQLFTETLKAAVEIEKIQRQQDTSEQPGMNRPGHETQSATIMSNQNRRTAAQDAAPMHVDAGEDSEAVVQGLDDFFLYFNPNPFLSLPMDFDPTTHTEWTNAFDP